MAAQKSENAEAGGGQIEHWNGVTSGPPDSNNVRGTGSSEAGSASVTMSWTLLTGGQSRQWAIGAVPLKSPLPYAVESIGVYKGVRRAIEVNL